MWPRWFTLGLLLISLSAKLAVAQIPVADVITELQTSLTAVQTTISAAEAVLHTGHWILEHTPLDELVMADEWIQDVQQMEQLVRTAQALGYDLGTLTALIQRTFQLESAAVTADELSIKLRTMRYTVSQGYQYAVQTQSLILTATRTVAHMLSLHRQISSLLGNLGGQQHLASAQSKLVQLATEDKVTGSAHRLAQGLERLQEPVILESLFYINESVMSTHPR
jgi:hypothetical protein